MRFCPIEHQFIQKSFHRQINDSNIVFGYSYRGWEPARVLWNLLEYFISIVDFAERQLEDMVIWAKALLSHECQLPLFPSYHWGTLLCIPPWLCHGSTLVLLENQALSMSNWPNHHQLQPHWIKHEAVCWRRDSERNERRWEEREEQNTQEKSGVGWGRSYSEITKRVGEGRGGQGMRGREGVGGRGWGKDGKGKTDLEKLEINNL